MAYIISMVQYIYIHISHINIMYCAYSYIYNIYISSVVWDINICVLVNFQNISRHRFLLQKRSGTEKPWIWSSFTLVVSVALSMLFLFCGEVRVIPTRYIQPVIPTRYIQQGIYPPISTPKLYSLKSKVYILSKLKVKENWLEQS